MKDFFKGPVFRALLGFLAFVLVGLMVWFLGPFLALGDLRPLASVGMRVTVLVLVFALMLSWLLEITFALVGVASLCVLVWHAGPLLGLASMRPLAPVWVRVLCIGLILLVFLIWGLYKLYKLLQNDEKFLQRWLRPDKAAAPLAKDRIRALSDMARRAVGQLRQMHMTVAGGTGSVWAGLRRLVEGKRYLYELPWYVVIGQPGAGKSSVVLNSGLRFPLADQMGAASARLTLSHATGTRQCDWWLTNEAVLLDTAGRYTEQDAQGVLDAPVAQVAPSAVSSDAAPTDAATVANPLETLRQTNEAEWHGFLGVLRQVRPRAPVNGALVVVDVAQLLQDNAAQRMAHAARLRARLAELRTHLGIRFPVYVVLTKADVLRGFSPYFNSLTSEARAQVWGFTLPWNESNGGLVKGLAQGLTQGLGRRARGTSAVGAPTNNAAAQADGPLIEQVRHEFDALVQRVSDGVATRLQEEFSLDQRQSLYVLPYELSALKEPLAALLDATFADSRYDTTQLHHMLRGVYLTSAMQSGDGAVVAERSALVQRLRAGLTQWGQTLGLVSKPEQAGATQRRSYFVTDALLRVVFAEAHLVKPNLKWEARMRLLRWLGHAAVVMTFFWLSGALTLSYHKNQQYLQDVDNKAQALTEQMQKWLSDQSMAQTEKVLGLAQVLPTHAGLDLAQPSASFLYGLYTAEPIAQASEHAYGQLLDRLVLPVVIERMEQVMREALTEEDSRLAYQTLRVYLMLHDAQKFSQTTDAAQAVREWVTADWQNASENSTSQGLAKRLGNSTAMVGHLEWLFSGKRVVQSAAARNEALVGQVRKFLDKNSSSERLYERMKSSLSSQAPQDFNLVRALGPQAGTLFSRASGQTLEKGVPGLFTYDGYHDVFAKRLPDMLALAQQDDAWVMGRQDGAASAKAAPLTAAEKQALLDDIRRQYLVQYAQVWTDFLGDIRLVKGDKSGTLSFELNVLRQLAAADSPLVRLSRLAARETTLSRPLQGDKAEQSIFEKAADQVDQQSNKVSKGLGLRPEQRAERQWVDERFSALREVVTGQSDGAAAGPGGKAGLDTVSNALNEFYTVLVVADTAITAGSLPPAGAEAATKLRIEAGKLPSPLREVLMDVSNSGTDKVGQGAANILRVQAQVQMDRLVGMMAFMVSEPCQRDIAGRYPFSVSGQEVSVDDFNALFASGGAADEYFKKYLSPLVDTSVRPWRYKNPASANAIGGADGQAQGLPLAVATAGPTLTGELLKLLAQGGPNPDVFAQIAQIREMFFRDPGAKRLSWRGEYKVVSLDPSVTELVIDVDGQTQRYSHGPVQTVALQWPGPRSGTMAELHAHPRIKPDTSSVQLRGPWAWLRLVERGKVTSSAQAGRIAVEYLLDNRRAVLEFSSAGPSPFNSALLRNFTCPGRTT
ncbi:type VI secretion system membrane subunit TssM [Limnohabitans sp. DM1]|uniref:type VI secretion system membrane subunit TssM n=1 Tax=Limnohabitans sp. DM1 TaxID=1597955 RepID=UPI000AA8D49A|nr:type VI secretion system membrane subunit TssM [Limnohabitans sp. DM1]